MKKLKRLLVIDDDVEECLILKEAVKQIDNNIEFECSYDGKNIISIIYDFKPNVILTDMMMPLISGVECLKEIKSHYPDLPVIVYSGSLSKDQLIKAYDEGSELVIQKPNSFSGLVNTMQAIFSIDWTNRVKIRDLYYGNFVTFPLDE